MSIPLNVPPLVQLLSITFFWCGKLGNLENKLFNITDDII